MLVDNFFGSAIVVAEGNREGMDVLAEHLEHGPLHFALDGFLHLPFWLAAAGALLAYVLYLKSAYKDDREKDFLGPLHRILDKKYYFDELYQWLFARGSVRVGKLLSAGGDQGLIDGLLVNGSAKLVGRLSYGVRQLQSGYLYQYAFTMILGLIVMLGFFVLYR